MWSRKRLDIGWCDLLFGAFRVCVPPQRAAITGRVEALWPAADHTLACLSVRTGFDLLLGALGLPRGSEVLMSAITIPDMVRIVEHHGLVPAPVDLDPQRMAPTLEDWQRAVTPATKLILVAHLFGGRTKMEPLLQFAREHGLLVVEDCAQAFAGTKYEGHPDADASMFSFGTIKSSTALGGAIVRVRDHDLLERMRTAQAIYPVQGRIAYLRRLLKGAALKALSSRPVCGLLVGVCRATGMSYDQWVNHAARGFPGASFFAQIRRQPSAPLLAVLERRLRRHAPERSAPHVAKSRALVGMLDGHVRCPGASIEPHTYWVFPVLTETPDRLVEQLTRAGFDATQGHSLCVVAPPASHHDGRATAADATLAKLVFLPLYPELPPDESRRLGAAILDFAAGNGHG